MEIRDTNFKKVKATDGMAIKWKEERWNYLHGCYEVSEAYSPNDALVDMNSIVGEITEVPMSEYEEWVKDKCYSLHPLYERN